jgi:signal transduction histidine kinase/CheY-like chemotaxis protein
MTIVLIALGIVVVLSIFYLAFLRRPATAMPAGDLPPERREGAVEGSDPDILDEPEAPAERQGRGGKLALLGDLAAGIAHEINNPVAIMVEEAGWIEDLLDEEEFKDSPNLAEFRRALKQIKTQGTRCKEIIQNLLTFGRKGGLKVQDVQLNDLIRDVVKSHEKRIRGANVELRTRLAENLPPVRLSPSEIQQILSNLLNNAADALEAKGGYVEISTRLVGDDVIVEVADNGHGIPPDILEKIFDPFFTTKPVGKGTGLGLSICYGLIERMGGDINVESNVGAGTTFRVRIPRAGQSDSARKAVAPRAGTLVEDEGSPLPVAPPTSTVVLIVDDEVPFVEALSKRLARRGLDVLTAFSGEEALEKLQRKREIEVVIMDVKMSGMDGIQALREIKAARPLVEVILLSAHTTVESAIEGIKLGAFDYLLKPCDVGQLVDQVARAKRRKDRQEQRIMEARIKEITSRRI